MFFILNLVKIYKDEKYLKLIVVVIPERQKNIKSIPMYTICHKNTVIKMVKNKDPSEKVTTMKLLEETKLRIEKLREHKRESYDDILRKILYVLNTARDSPEKARRILERISELRERMLKEEKEQEEDLEKENQIE
jgi:threonine dehydrogenase-like Zn-dependent dehydrogenase